MYSTVQARPRALKQPQKHHMMSFMLALIKQSVAFVVAGWFKYILEEKKEPRSASWPALLLMKKPMLELRQK